MPDPTVPDPTVPDPTVPDPTVAAFDFDGTLTRGGSVFPWLVWIRGREAVLRAAAPLTPAFGRAAIASGDAADRSKERLLAALLSGLPVERVAEQSRQFATHHVDRRLRPQVAERLQWHRRQGHRVVLVSASPELYIAPAGALLGADHVIATRLEVDGSGRLTGRYEGRNCRGAEKLSRLETWLSAPDIGPAGTSRPTLWAYGNSRGDLRMLAAADRGIDASMLGRYGRLRRYRSLRTLTEPEAEPAAGSQ